MLMLHIWCYILAPSWFGLCFPAMKGGRYMFYAFQTWQYKIYSIFWLCAVYNSFWRRSYPQQIILYNFRGFMWTDLEFGNTKKKFVWGSTQIKSNRGRKVTPLHLHYVVALIWKAKGLRVVDSNIARNPLEGHISSIFSTNWFSPQCGTWLMAFTELTW